VNKERLVRKWIWLDAGYMPNGYTRQRSTASKFGAGELKEYRKRNGTDKTALFEKDQFDKMTA
jgi:hypothetical protein